METIENEDIVCAFSGDKKDQNELIHHVNTTKSFTLSTHGCISNRSEPVVSLNLYISCISNCTISFMRCKFLHSLFIIEDANIDISGTIFVDSYLIVQSICAWNDLSIIQTDFQIDANHSSTLFNKSMPFEEACQTSRLLEGILSGNGSFPWTVGKRDSSERYCAVVNLRGMWKSITLEALSFIGSDVTSHRTGGVYLTEVEVMVMKMSNSQVTKLPTKVLLGSSSSIETLTVQHSSFNNNTDGLDLGDTFIQRFFIINCSFTSNGPGLRTEFTKCTSAIIIDRIMNMSLINSYFTENSAGTNAGLQCHGAVLRINSPLYRHQQSITASNDSRGIQTEITIMDSIFKDNVNRYGNGGAISLTGPMTLRIHNVQFIANSAGLGLGGAVHVEQSAVLVSNSMFIRNVARVGAGIYLINNIDSSLKYTYTHDDEYYNTYNNYFDDYDNINDKSGTIEKQNCVICLAVTLSLFDNNYASESGGGIHVQGLSHVEVFYCNFTENMSQQGTAVHKTGGTIRICGSLVSFNRVSYGGIITLQDSQLHMDATIFSDNFGQLVTVVFYDAIEYCYIGERDSAEYSKIDIIGFKNDQDIFHQKSCHYIIITACKFLGTKSKIMNDFRKLTIISIQMAYLTVTKQVDIVINHSEFDSGRVRINSKSLTINFNQTFAILIYNNSFTRKSEMENGLSIFINEGAKIYDYANLKVVVSSCSFRFNKNTFLAGGAVTLDVYKPDVSSEGSWEISVLKCNFTRSEATDQGGAIRMYFIAKAGIQNSTNKLNFYQCIFLLNRAKYGGALAIMYGGEIYDSSLWPQEVNFNIVILACYFEDNKGIKEGGAIFLELISTVQVLVENCTFLNNDAGTGSGIFREAILPLDTCGIYWNQKGAHHEIDKLKCQNVAFQRKQLTTIILHSRFVSNSNTAIILLASFSDRHLKAKVKDSVFINNSCTTSRYGDDIYSDANLSLEKLVVLKDHSLLWSKSIDAASEIVLSDVEINISSSLQTQQILVASFSLYKQNNVANSITITCPPYYRPVVNHAGLTHEGASMVEVICNACTKGYYYIGDKTIELFIWKDIFEQLICFKRVNPYVTGEEIMTAFCYTKIIGKCAMCPFGAQCTGGARAKPNHWGHKTSDDSLEFHRCPYGYCCSYPPCYGIGQCALNREGYLCGQCSSNYTEALFSPQCVLNTKCKSYWVSFIYFAWVVLLTSLFIFFGEITNILISIWKKFKPLKKLSPRTKGVSDEETQNPIREMFCKGFVTVTRHQSEESSASYKYMQILLFYLQDAYLMQINLENDSSEGQIAVIRHVLYNISHLAFDVLNFGLELCPWEGWTPVIKQVAKSSTGPVMIMLLILVYLVIRCVCTWMPKNKQTISRQFWFPKLSCATLLCLLVFYQQTAMVTFSFLYCISGHNKHVLFIDGTIDCYQPWQIAVFVFASFWVVPFVLVLTFAPGMMDANLINITDFFFLCAFPIPVSIFLLYKYLNKKLMVKPNGDLTSKREVLNLLQKSYIDIIVLKNTKICWIGVITARRLTLILFFTFIENLVLRLSAMVLLTLLFLVCLHQKIYPYQDNMANRVFTVSLVLSCLIGNVNMMKATCIEFLLDLDSGKETIKLLDIFLDVIMIWCPATLSLFAIMIHSTSRIYKKLHCLLVKPCKWRVVNVKPIKVQ